MAIEPMFTVLSLIVLYSVFGVLRIRMRDCNFMCVRRQTVRYILSLSYTTYAGRKPLTSAASD